MLLDNSFSIVYWVYDNYRLVYTEIVKIEDQEKGYSLQLAEIKELKRCLNNLEQKNWFPQMNSVHEKVDSNLMKVIDCLKSL